MIGIAESHVLKVCFGFHSATGWCTQSVFFVFGMYKTGFDELVKSHLAPLAVIPAKTGIQYLQAVANHLGSGACPGHDPGFAGSTTFYELVGFEANIDTILLSRPKDASVEGESKA